MEEDWLELESDPGVFTLILESFGVQDVEVVDYYDHADPMYHAFIFLFPWSTAQQQLGTAGVPVTDERILKRLFFAKQTAQNSCGMNALLSVMFNCAATRNKLGPELVSLRKQLDEMTAIERGDTIGKSQLLLERNNRHASAYVERSESFSNEPELKAESEAKRRAKRKSGDARKRDSQASKKVNGQKRADSSSNESEAKAPPRLKSCRPRRSVAVRSPNHYVAFIPFAFEDGSTHLLELDGLRSAPIDHGPLASASSLSAAFVDRFDEVVRARTSEQPTFVQLAVVPSRLHTAKLRLSRLQVVCDVFTQALALKRREAEMVSEIQSILRESAVSDQCDQLALDDYIRAQPASEMTTDACNPDASARSDCVNCAAGLSEEQKCKESELKSADAEDFVRSSVRSKRISQVRSVQLLDAGSDGQSTGPAVRHVPVKLTHRALSQRLGNDLNESKNIVQTDLVPVAQPDETNGPIDKNRNTKKRVSKRGVVESLAESKKARASSGTQTPCESVECEPGLHDPATADCGITASSISEPVLLRVEYEEVVKNGTEENACEEQSSAAVDYLDSNCDLKQEIASLQRRSVDVASLERVLTELNTSMKQLTALVKDEEVTRKRYRDEQARRVCDYDKFLRFFVAAFFRNGDPDWCHSVLYYVVKHPEEADPSLVTACHPNPNGVTNCA